MSLPASQVFWILLGQRISIGRHLAVNTHANTIQFRIRRQMLEADDVDGPSLYQISVRPLIPEHRHRVAVGTKHAFKSDQRDKFLPIPQWISMG